MGADLPRGRRAALIVLVALAACDGDAAAPADAALPDAAPAARCRPDGCAWHAVASGTGDRILTFIAGEDGVLRAASTSSASWIAPSGEAFAPLAGERPPLTSYVERTPGATLGTVAGAATVLRARDGGEVFTPEPTGSTVPLGAVIEAFGTYVALGGASPIQIRISNELGRLGWTAAEVPSAAGGLFGGTAAMTPATPFVTVAVGQSQNRAYVLRSTSFSGVWDAQPAGETTPPLRAVAWNRRIPGVLVAVGDKGTVLRSEDGAAWTAVAVDTRQDLLAVASVGPLFVAAGKGGTVLVSADGAAWTVGAAGSEDLGAVGGDGTRAYVAGAGGALFRSDPF